VYLAVAGLRYGELDGAAQPLQHPSRLRKPGVILTGDEQCDSQRNLRGGVKRSETLPREADVSKATRVDTF